MFAFAPASDPAELRFITPAKRCSWESMAGTYRSDTFVHASIAEQLSAPATRALIEGALFDRRDERYAWRCIIRLHHERYVLPLQKVFALSGSGRVQMEHADGALYVASADSCDTTATILREVMLAVEHRSISSDDVHECVGATLSACGYPANLSIQPSDHSNQDQCSS
jgi:hypothetical protein